MAAGGDELGTTLVLLGASAAAIVLTLKSLCGFFSAREAETGRQLTEEEIDSLLTVAEVVPELQGIKRTLADLTAAVERLTSTPAYHAAWSTDDDDHDGG